VSDAQLQELVRLLGLTKDREIDCDALATRLAEIAEPGGGLTGPTRDALDEHLRLCGDCQEELAAVRAALESDSHEPS